MEVDGLEVQVPILLLSHKILSNPLLAVLVVFIFAIH